LANYLYDNQTCDYIFIDILKLYWFFGETYEQTCSHVILLVFDNIRKISYIFDSNNFDEQNQNLIKMKKIDENFFAQNFIILNDTLKNLFDIPGYTFLNHNSWNPKNINLNINYGNEMKDGNCYIFIFIIANFLQESKKHIVDIIEEFNNISNEEKVFILKTFYNYISNLYPY
jgi:hypothetical protein